MGRSKKSMLIALCLLLLTFKAMAGSVFVRSAIERAHIQATSCVGVEIQENAQERGSDKESVHNLYIMYHVMGDINDMVIVVPALSASSLVTSAEKKLPRLSNTPNSLYKPPKFTA
jgi:hypothetical protein